MSNRTYNEDELNDLAEKSSKISQNLEAISKDTTSYYNKIDSRILRKFSDTFSQINNYNGKIQNDIDNIETYGNWLNQTLEDYTGTRTSVEDRTPDLSDISADVGDTSLGEGDASLKDLSSISSIIGSTVGGLGSADKAEQFPLDPEAWGNLSGSEKEAIVKKLKELGFTDEEINNIKDGKVSVDKVRLEELASQLEKLYKLDPNIRQKLKDLYGFDIFNDDGTVNKEKLAIAMLMDAKNPNDQYDLKTLLTKLSANTSTGDNSNKSTTGNVTKVVANDIGGFSQTTSTIAGAAAGLGATVAAVGGTTSKATGLAASAEEEALANEKELSDKDSKNSNILDGLKSEMNHVINSIKPSGNISTKQGNAAIMAGAGLGTASLAGGGIMAGKKIMMLVFKPEHFTNLSEVIKDTILNTFKALKFTEEELDLFMTSNLKIKASLIDDMITAIKKASELDTELDSKIKQVYNFSVFTENNKISKYLILMIMLIDGKKIGDQYNIYDILNPILAETDYVNYTYQGVSLQDIVVKEKEEKKETKKQQPEEVKQAEIKANKEEILDENEDSKTSTTSTSSVESWLKEMGINS